MSTFGILLCALVILAWALATLAVLYVNYPTAFRMFCRQERTRIKAALQQLTKFTPRRAGHILGGMSAAILCFHFADLIDTPVQTIEGKVTYIPSPEERKGACPLQPLLRIETDDKVLDVSVRSMHVVKLGDTIVCEVQTGRFTGWDYTYEGHVKR